MSKPTYTAEYQAIAHILMNQYSEGGKQAKSEIMKPAFHPQATMHSVGEQGLTGGLVGETLFPTIDEHFKPSENPKVAIAYIDITGTAASARVDTDDLSGYGFTDYFNLLKIDGEWKVVSKIFHAHY